METEQIMSAIFLIAVLILILPTFLSTNNKIKKITELILKKVKYVVLDADALTCFKNDLKSLYLLLDKNFQ